MQNKLLRRYIRKIISEVATSIDAANSNPNLGLLITKEGKNSIVIAVDLNEFNIAFKGPVGSRVRDEKYDLRIIDEKTASNMIVGYIMFGPSRHNGQSWDANEVYYSAARKGYGPLMYDIAMSMSGNLMSDRQEVSASAERVWSVYFGRKDVEHKKIDDIDNPKTRTKKDDGFVFPEEEKEPLNYVYSLKGTIDVKSMEDRLLAASEVISKMKSITVDKLLDAVVLTAKKYFFFKTPNE
jgi:hypothetical protein